jgi:hypothetical protein
LIQTGGGALAESLTRAMILCAELFSELYNQETDAIRTPTAGNGKSWDPGLGSTLHCALASRSSATGHLQSYGGDVVQVKVFGVCSSVPA